jgi:hypothetical protein
MQWVFWAACVGGPLGLVVLPARADGAPSRARVVVLPVQARSTLPDSTRVQLRGTIERGLQRADVEIVSDALVDGEPGADSCFDARCASRLAEALDAEWILRSTITRVDAVYEVQLDALDGRGRTLASASERCEICGHDEVSELVVDRSAALAAKVRLLERQSPRLVVRSRPSRAAVWIDDQLVGHTPLEHEVEAGEHEVRLELRGYTTERRSVTALAGTEDALELVLHDDPEAERRRRTWRGVGGAALGLGTGMLGAGVGLAIIDEQPYERRCNPDPLGHCRQRYDTLGGGIALMVSGGALVATGVVALVVSARGKRAGARQAGRWRVGRGLAIAF